MLALIDGDAITFIAASSADGRVYVCADGSEHKYKKDALKVDPSPTLEYRPEPDAHAKHNARLLIEDALASAGTSDCVIYLKGDGNFREEIFDAYKANRENTRRPHHISTVRNYLNKHYSCAFVDGMEVDDALGIIQYNADDEDDTIIITHDKDLDMIPGWHLRIKRGGEHARYFINEPTANHIFWLQVLTGDTTDNIAGIKGVGPKTAEKMLEGMQGSSYDEYQEEVRRIYVSKGYTTEDFERARDLIWILREPLGEPNNTGAEGGGTE